ncbi:hypothetical protein [Streptomyces sp. CC77]|uniref:hypothetical protein n=1 Tax=Streptomyces sp. CC77 TaxID=1906739 RepID=UPI0008DE341D|nr:hypothetical protein [Streptomyces sp. CC77]OII67460.1 hypothetical protein BJP39_00970 [Streptomyces sp. CC77]
MLEGVSDTLRQSDDLRVGRFAQKVTQALASPLSEVTRLLLAFVVRVPADASRVKDPLDDDGRE